MSLAPIYINFMLACYTRSDPEVDLGTAHWNSPAGKETRNWLIYNGLVNEKYEATDRGKAWIKFICDTPLPEQAWLNPITGKIAPK